MNLVEFNGKEIFCGQEDLSNLLKQIIDCEKIALVSIIGQNSGGCKFIVSSLINYLECTEKDKWPYCPNSIIQRDHYFWEDYSNSIPSIKLCKQPFIFEPNNEKIAILLMYTEGVFYNSENFLKSKIEKDVIEVLINLSSTVVFGNINYLKVSFRKLYQTKVYFI
jgi:hypothetical protein